MEMSDEDREASKARLEKEIGYAFPHGITDIIFEFLVAFDARNIPKEKITEMCKKVGVSHTGHKKLVAARLLANEFGLRERKKNSN